MAKLTWFLTLSIVLPLSNAVNFGFPDAQKKIDEFVSNLHDTTHDDRVESRSAQIRNHVVQEPRMSNPPIANINYQISTSPATPASSNIPIPNNLNLSGKVAFIAGVSDANGFGWAIAKSLYGAGATVVVGSWAPMAVRFQKLLSSGALDNDRVLDDDEVSVGRGGKSSKRMLEIQKIYALDVAYDKPEDIPNEIKANKRFAAFVEKGFTISEVAKQVVSDFGKVDFLVHAIANGPEVSKPILQTSRKGYMGAVSSSSYSFVSLVQNFSPYMPPGGAVLTLTYVASVNVVPGYGGGMSSAKAALESDTRTLAFEVGRKYKLRVNAISAGPLKSRAASAISRVAGERPFIDLAISYNEANAPLKRSLAASDVADTALFLLSPMARAITGSVVYVDNGMHSMGMVPDSLALQTPV